MRWFSVTWIRCIGCASGFPKFQGQEFEEFSLGYCKCDFAQNDDEDGDDDEADDDDDDDRMLKMMMITMKTIMFNLFS